MRIGKQSPHQGWLGRGPSATTTQALCKLSGIQMLILPILMDAEVGASSKIILTTLPALEMTFQRREVSR